jgi:hypothetical protein
MNYADAISEADFYEAAPDDYEPPAPEPRDEPEDDDAE